MGTVNFTVGRYARTRGAGAAELMSTEVRTSDAFTSTTAAANIEDGSGDITLTAGEVFRVRISEDAWIAFGGATATVGNDFFLAANTDYTFEVKDAGTVSIIDVA